MMSYCWAVRIHVDCLGDSGVEDFKSFVKSLGSEGYVFVRETDATREHIQGWIFTDLKQQAFRARVKRMFPGVVGNKGYSISQVKNYDAYYDYVLKGTPDETADVVCSHSVELNDRALQDAHRRYWSKKETGHSKGAIVKEVYDWACTMSDVRKESVVEYACDAIVGRNKPLMVPYVIGVVNSVMYKLGGCEKYNIIEYISANIR